MIIIFQLHLFSLLFPNFQTQSDGREGSLSDSGIIERNPNRFKRRRQALSTKVNTQSNHGQHLCKTLRRRKMHSFGYRANALLTFAVTILAVMCTMASFSDNFNIPSPSADVKVSFLSQFMLLLLSFLGCCFVFLKPQIRG